MGKPKGRVLTPSELELAEGLARALGQKSGAKILLREAELEVSKLTQKINELAEFKQGRSRIGVIWAEARELAGEPQAPKQSELVR